MHQVIIEYCPKCKWLPRASWLAQEILGTFEEINLELTLRKSLPGVFKVLCNGVIIYDRKRDGGFPEPTFIKQKIRDIIAPELLLGHTDKTKREA